MPLRGHKPPHLLYTEYTVLQYEHQAVEHSRPQMRSNDNDRCIVFLFFNLKFRLVYSAEPFREGNSTEWSKEFLHRSIKNSL